MKDAHESYEFEEGSMGENCIGQKCRDKSNGHRNQLNPSYIVETMRSFRVEL
jgi:hypothetical protein